MLQSSHRPAPPPAASPPIHHAPLPAGWSQHTAPTGHPYYYNAETKESTYQRPSARVPQAFHTPPPPPPPTHNTPAVDPFSIGNGFIGFGAVEDIQAYGQAPFRQHQQSLQISDRRPRQPQDRPKTRHEIPDCAPWLLVKTRLRRRFVHNPEMGASFWKVPEHLVQGLVEFDVRERKREEGTLDEYLASLKAKAGAVGPKPHDVSPDTAAEDTGDREEGSESSDEYEEVEVTDDEAEDNDGASPSAKRPRLEPDLAEAQTNEAPHEFNEEDMAYQLAQMGQDYALDPGEYGNDEAYPEEQDETYDDDEGGAAGLATTGEEATAAFHDALTDYGISPYTTWDRVIADPDSPLLSDARYTLLPTTKARRAAFDAWSTMRIAQLKALEADQKLKRMKQHPRVKYLELLSERATPKLYWPEFRRKYKKEKSMQDRELSDKEREKLYREFVGRVTKKSERERRGDLRELLRDVPVSKEWCRGVDVQTLVEEKGAMPEMVVGDLRWAVLGRREREDVLRVFVEGLPSYRGEAA